MAQLLVHCLVLVFFYGGVTSQGDKGFSSPRQVAPLEKTSTTQSEIVFPNENEDVITVYSHSTMQRRETTKMQTVASPTLFTTVSNEVDPRQTFELASEAVHSVSTRLHHLLEPSGRKNYLVSPLSVALLTGQLLLAARGDSERRLRNLLTGVRAPWAPAANTSNTSSPDSVTSDTLREADLKLHTQLGALLKHLQGQAGEGQGENSTYQLTAASAFFLSHDLQLKNSFKEAVISLYGSDLIRLNFSGDPVSALVALNKWAFRNTAGRIPTIFEAPLSRNTAVVLVNSVYFRSEWQMPFDPELTAPGVFRLNGTHQIRVQNMRGQFEDINFVDHPELACRMVVLPYKSPDVNMYVILPHRDVGEVKDFAMKLTSRNITNLIKASTLNTVTVVLPKMKLTGTYSLKDPIMRYKPQSQLQFKDILEYEGFSLSNRRNRTSTTFFTSNTEEAELTPSTKTTQRTPSTKTTKRTPSTKTTQRTPSTKTTQRPPTPTTATAPRPSVRPSKPTTNVPNKPKPVADRPMTNRPNNGNKPWFDLTGASPDERFRINDIIHQISLEVSETGTEAAAITSGSVDYSGNVKVIKVDRPFLFFIRHEPSLVNLFYGVIMDPTNGDYE